MTPSSRLLITALSVTLLCGSGCTPRPQWGGGQYGSGNRTGGERYTIQYLTDDNRVYLVVWADGCDLRPGSGLQPSYVVWGSLTAPGGRHVRWCCEMDGTRVHRDSGGLSIGELARQPDGLEGFTQPVPEFRLSNGGLFLVYGLERPVRVEQIPVDPSGLGLPPNPDELLRMFGSDARVAAFHAACMGRR